MPLMHAQGDQPARMNKSPRSVSPHPLAPVTVDKRAPEDANGKRDASPRRKEADAQGGPALLPVPKPADSAPPPPGPLLVPVTTPAPAAPANSSPQKTAASPAKGENEAARDSPKRTKKDKKDRDEGSRSKGHTDSPLRKNA